MRVRSPKPGWLYVRLAWRRQLGRFNRWSPPPARPCRCLRCQRKRDAQGRVAAEVERVLATGAPGVDWRELLPQPDPAAIKAEIERVPGVASVSILSNSPGRITGTITVDAGKGSGYMGDVRAESSSTFNLPKSITITIKVDGRGFRDLLVSAYLQRTRTGAWLVKGRGPTRRYSTQALADKAGRERDRRYAARRRP